MDQKSLKLIETIINKAIANLVTKDDAKSFASKDDLKNFATKDDLKSFATKDDLKSFATKDDLKSFATKDDLLAMEKRLTKEIQDVEISVTVSADKNKAEKTDLEKLERRVDKIEQKLAH